MLLGSGKRLQLRREIKNKLHDDYGYPYNNIIIMEDTNQDEKQIIKKFGNILGESSPELFFALFESSVDMGGVIFELGWLCGIYTRIETTKRIRLISDFDYPWKATTGYLRTLILNSQFLPIGEMTVDLISDTINENTLTSLNVYDNSTAKDGHEKV
jgi:hypothetical protein